MSSFCFGLKLVLLSYMWSVSHQCVSTAMPSECEDDLCLRCGVTNKDMIVQFIPIVFGSNFFYDWCGGNATFM